jgi:tRNA pseudouridine55 synthase
MNGLFIVNKSVGMTSHDVVNAVRRLAGLRRVGHAGTLDPLAQGVLVLLLGPTTRLSRFVMGHNKRYRAVVRLGEVTPTYDAESEVTERRSVRVTRAEVEDALAQFRGPIRQIPPMYSAVRVKGQRLYKLARRGQQVERPPRDVTLHQLELVTWASPDVTLDVTCSAGTYIRTLAHDLGETLGCGAHLAALTRTASGPFTLAQSHTLDALRALAEDGRLATALLPPTAALSDIPAAVLTPEQEHIVRHGQAVHLVAPEGAAWVQALDADGHLIAVLIPVETDRWRPKLVLPPER